jgi:hypothetical protein
MMTIISDEIDEEVDLEEGSNSISSAAKKAEASRQRALRKAISAVKNGQHPDSAIRDHDLFKSDAAELHKHYKENVEVDGEPIDEISTTLARNYLNHNIRDSGERALNKSQHDHYDKAAFGDSDKSKANERSLKNRDKGFKSAMKRAGLHPKNAEAVKRGRSEVKAGGKQEGKNLFANRRSAGHDKMNDGHYDARMALQGTWHPNK